MHLSPLTHFQSQPILHLPPAHPGNCELHNVSTKSSRQPEIVGSKTEASLLNLKTAWGFEPDATKASIFNEKHDKVFAFNSVKKRSTSVIRLSDGRVRLYCKGASEYVLKSCAKYLSRLGVELDLENSKRAQLYKLIEDMAQNAHRTLVLAHKNYPCIDALPFDWISNPYCAVMSKRQFHRRNKLVW